LQTERSRTSVPAAAPSLWVQLLGAETRFYDAGGIRTRSIEAGSGHPLIFLHGIGGHAEAFARNVIPLSRSFRVHAIDYLGHGYTASIDKPITVDAYVKHLIDFMDAAGIERAHLAGESLGGWIAAWAALLAPERVADIVYIVGAKLAVPVDESAAKRTSEGRAELVRLSKQFADDPSRENIRARMAWLFFDPAKDLSEELVDVRWELYQRSRSIKGENGVTPRPNENNGPETDLTPERLRAIKHRTLVLWTDHNPSVGVAEAKSALDYLPNAEFALMERCGHWPQWENAETFNRIVSEFLLGGT
jgi:pimeloyl-ACP methyl ester carboxylesterase